MDQPVVAIPQEKPAGRRNWFRPVLDNPVILKELRGRMRGRRAFLLLTGYLTLISLFIGLIYISLAAQSSFQQPSPEFRQVVGKTIFSTVVLLELFMVSIIGPALTAGAITSERERQTFDLLRTTLISSRALVLGKLSSAAIYLLLLIFTALPIESLAFLLGGVGIEELLISGLMLIVTAAFFSALGLFFSSFMKRTQTASVTSFATIVVSSLGLGLTFFILTTSSSFFSSTPSKALIETITAIILWLMISTNPLLAASYSEYVLVQDQSLFLTKSFPGSLTLPSPWIPFIIIYSVATVLLVILSIRFVGRPDR